MLPAAPNTFPVVVSRKHLAHVLSPVQDHTSRHIAIHPDVHIHAGLVGRKLYDGIRTLGNLRIDGAYGNGIGYGPEIEKREQRADSMRQDSRARQRR